MPDFVSQMTSPSDSRQKHTEARTNAQRSVWQTTSADAAVHACSSVNAYLEVFVSGHFVKVQGLPLGFVWIGLDLSGIPTLRYLLAATLSKSRGCPLDSSGFVWICLDFLP